MEAKKMFLYKNHSWNWEKRKKVKNGNSIGSKNNILNKMANSVCDAESTLVIHLHFLYDFFFEVFFMYDGFRLGETFRSI